MKPAVRPKVRIAPSVLNADFGRLADQIALVEAGGADWLHLDVMDGHFVPNISFGVPVVAGIAQHTKLFLDTHLMIAQPERYVEPFAKAGARLLTFHIEATREPETLIDQIRAAGCQVGIAINPDTPVWTLFDLLPRIDLALVMTVFPGFGGQKFIHDCLPKMAALRERMRPEQTLEVDGGINLDTAPLAVAAGADTLVAGAVIYQGADPREMVGRLRARAAAGV